MKRNKKHIENITTEDKGQLVRIVAVIIPLCFFSVFVAAAVISLSNDMYAFVKPDKTINAVFSEEPRSLYSTAKQLDDYGVIENPAIFSLYVKSKNAEERVSAFSGELELNSSMSYREILKSFSKK